jgi:hypothetical protein
MLSDTPSERIPPQRGYPLRENNPSERIPPQREYMCIESICVAHITGRGVCA